MSDKEYSFNIDYTAKIIQAKENGDLEQAAIYEQIRNAKIDGEGLLYAKTFEFTKHIYIDTKMTAMPKTCEECSLNRKSRFSNSAVCHMTGNQTRAYTYDRPIWCPLKEVKKDE